MNKEDAGTYPEFMLTDVFDEHFKNAEHKDFNDYDEAVKFLKENIDWQIYTEIEADSPDPNEEETKFYMDRGFHICNRTDNYSVVKDPRYKVMKYTGLD